VDLDAVMGLAATACMELTAADGAAVEIIEGPLMVYRAAAGSALSQIGLGLDAEHSLSGLCARSGAPLCCEDAETRPPGGPGRLPQSGPAGHGRSAPAL
jgi:hypothetical protein